MTTRQQTKQKTRPHEVVPCELAKEIFEDFLRHNSPQRASSPMSLARQLCARLRREGRQVNTAVERGVHALVVQALNLPKEEPGPRIKFTVVGSGAALYSPVTQA